MLTPLQEQVAQIIAGLEEAKEFALAGGAALIARGDVQRETRDLDFFGLTADAVDRLVPAVDRALRDAGLVVHHIQVNPGFARLIVESADDRTELDLAADARLFPAEPGRPAPMLSGEELAVDKLLALFGRAEARDFVDLMEVEPRYGLDRLCRLAAEKDRGFMPGVLADMLARFSRLRREEFGLDDARYEQLGREVVRWREHAHELARRREIERGRGRDLGLER
ncbi:MAG: nucleotidyl transferase AbiEii/AbiGii toxin family protein [Actinomycetota bacterium]|nr:nucleotidyl transferase AbiEii/AbiGii toxin family protein [Actinomycetota bacterium]